MISVGVIGATGYAGAELVRILAGHPEVELAILTSRNYAGEHFATVYPAMSGIVHLKCEAYDVERVCARADVLFTALPHKLPMSLVPALLQHNKKIIDLSADFRFQDAAVYEAAYQPHTAKSFLPQTVYGLSEIYFDKIQAAHLIGNPGCYPTSSLLPLVPLLKEGVVDQNFIIIDSKSGVSGAGRSPSLTTAFCEVNESLKAYKIATHRHIPEIEAVLSQVTGRPRRISFTPHLVPMSRGMLTTIYLSVRPTLNGENVSHIFNSFYQNAPFIRILPEGTSPDTLHVRGTNFCDIGFKLDKRNKRLILLSVIDNLVKGAAGQAVQNMNIMLGLDERTGLASIPYPV